MPPVSEATELCDRRYASLMLAPAGKQEVSTTSTAHQAAAASPAAGRASRASTGTAADDGVGIGSVPGEEVQQRAKRQEHGQQDRQQHHHNHHHRRGTTPQVGQSPSPVLALRQAEFEADKHAVLQRPYGRCVPF